MLFKRCRRKFAQDLWQIFMIEVHVDSNCDVKNFLGSVVHHKILFDRAVEKLIGGVK